MAVVPNKLHKLTFKQNKKDTVLKLKLFTTGFSSLETCALSKQDKEFVAKEEIKNKKELIIDNDQSIEIIVFGFYLSENQIYIDVQIPNVGSGYMIFSDKSYLDFFEPLIGARIYSFELHKKHKRLKGIKF